MNSEATNGSGGLDEELQVTSYQPFIANPGDVITGICTGGACWADFYVQPESLIERTQEMNARINSFYMQHYVPSLSQINALKVGMPCAVQYGKDQQWYRAVVEDTSYKMVRFVDYGNAQICKEDDIKPLMKVVNDIQLPTCLRCTLTPAQDLKLPTFSSDRSDPIEVIVLGTTEPYEVALKILKTGGNTDVADAPAVVPAPTANAPNKNALPTGGPFASRVVSAQGLSLMAQRNRSVPDFEDDDPKALKATASASSLRPTRQRYVPGPQTESRVAIQHARGVITTLHATCGSICLEQYPVRVSEVNTEQSTFCRGPLKVNDLRRLFRAKERVFYSAKLEQPYLTSEMEWSMTVAEDNDPEYKKKKVKKTATEKNERWLVTDFRPYLSDPNVVVTHAVITFVGENACSLYVRGSEETIWAPQGTFPENIARSERLLTDLVEVGRSVIVRAESSTQWADFNLRSTWVAKAVEFVGETCEEQGTMYLVRENYSVIMTEGNVGFGYAFVPNQCVDAAGVPLEEWYGTKVFFRSCIDVPDNDRDEFKYGFRMKALRAHLSPEQTKGPYKYAGIYRPSQIHLDDTPPLASSRNFGQRKWLDDDEGRLDLPTEAIEEMRLLGQDTIGISDTTKTTTTYKPDDVISMVRENLQNESRNCQAATTVKKPTVKQIEESSIVQKEGTATTGISPTAAAAPTVKNRLDEFDLLTSTVEIFMGVLPEADTYPLYSLDPIHLIGKSGNDRPIAPVQRLSVACQTEGDVESEIDDNPPAINQRLPTIDPEEEERLRKEALKDLERMTAEDFNLLALLVMKLDQERQRRFEKLFR